MSTTIRPEVSKKKEYYIPRERYYELLHFCRQYPMWQRDKEYLATLESSTFIKTATLRNGKSYSRVEAIAILREGLSKKLDLVDRLLSSVADGNSELLKEGIVYGKSYEAMAYKHNYILPKKAYYDMYRRFFWLLDRERD